MARTVAALPEGARITDYIKSGCDREDLPFGAGAVRLGGNKSPSRRPNSTAICPSMLGGVSGMRPQTSVIFKCGWFCNISLPSMAYHAFSFGTKVASATLPFIAPVRHRPSKASFAQLCRFSRCIMAFQKFSALPSAEGRCAVRAVEIMVSENPTDDPKTAWDMAGRMLSAVLG